MKPISLRLAACLVAGAAITAGCLNNDSSSGEPRNSAQNPRVKVEKITLALGGGYSEFAKVLATANIAVYSTACGYWQPVTSTSDAVAPTYPGGAGTLFFEFEIDASNLENVRRLDFVEVTSQSLAARRNDTIHSPCDLY